MNLSNLPTLLIQLELDPLARGLQIIDAQELAADSFPRLDTDRPALVLNINSSALVAAAARTLAVNYPAAHPIGLVEQEITHIVSLDSLAQIKASSSDAVLYIPALEHPSSPLTLANIMARLRAPNGCPWDIEQTHASLTRALIEEAYEVVEAIAENDSAQLKEELGDLFLHVLFQTQIARDEKEFTFAEMGQELAAKLIRRHPHVFGDEQATDAGTVLANWERIKQEEKERKGTTTRAETLETGIPRDLPSLVRAQKVQERARRKKIAARNGTLPAALVTKLKRSRGAQREKLLGALLLELAGVGEAAGIDAERALRSATKALAQKTKSKK